MMRWTCCLLALGFTAVAQAQQPDVVTQRQAMKKLEFLVGRWSGPAAIWRGPGEPMRITQSEDVQFKLDGLLLLVEGTGRNAAGEIVFRALATISYDDATASYRFRAYHDGSYLDTELKVSPGGFEWGYTAGSLKVSNIMRLTEKGEWAEITETTFGAAPPNKAVEMTLRRQP